MENKIQDRSNDRMYFTQTPMVVWAHCNDVYEYALWNTIKMIAGEAGECYLNTNDLAALSMMSVGKVAACRESLIANGLIEGEKRIHDGQQLPVWHLRIPDLWPLNIDVAGKYPKLKDKVSYKENQRRGFSCGEKPSTPHEKPSTPHEKPSTPHEKPSTPHERKNIYNKNQNDNQGKNQGGDQRVQDLPSPAEPQTPPPTALPIKADEPDHAQPVQQQQAKPYDFQSGLPQPKRVQEKRAIDVKVQEAKNLEISPADFRKMVDILLDASQKLAFINAQQKDSEDPDVAKELSDHRDAILFAAGLTEKYRTPEAIKAIIDDWKNENPRFKQIYPKQFKIHAANLLSKPVPSQPTSEAAKKEDTAFWSGELVDIGLKYNVTARKIKPGTGRKDPVTNKYIEEVYEDEEPAVEAQKAA